MPFLWVQTNFPSFSVNVGLTASYSSPKDALQAGQVILFGMEKETDSSLPQLGQTTGFIRKCLSSKINVKLTMLIGGTDQCFAR